MVVLPFAYSWVASDVVTTADDKRRGWRTVLGETRPALFPGAGGRVTRFSSALASDEVLDGLARIGDGQGSSLMSNGPPTIVIEEVF